MKVEIVCNLSDLKWAEHVDAIVSNAASHIHFLKRADVQVRDLLHYTLL